MTVCFHSLLPGFDYPGSRLLFLLYFYLTKVSDCLILRLLSPFEIDNASQKYAHISHLRLISLGCDIFMIFWAVLRYINMMANDTLSLDITKPLTTNKTMLKDVIESVVEIKELYQTTSRVSRAGGVILAGTVGLATTISTMHQAGLYPIHMGLKALKKDNIKNFYQKCYEKLSF